MGINVPQATIFGNYLITATLSLSLSRITAHPEFETLEIAVAKRLVRRRREDYLVVRSKDEESLRCEERQGTTSFRSRCF